MRRVIGFALLAATLALGGCTTIHVDSPVGTWTADGDESGTLRIGADGTFTISDASFNPVQNRSANDNDFQASGTWRLRDDSSLFLRFEKSTQASADTGRMVIAREYTSGTIRFEDPEQTGSIEFRLSPDGD